MNTKDVRVIDWNRVGKFASDEERKTACVRTSAEVVSMLKEITSISGEATHSRQTLICLAKILLHHKVPLTIVPVCQNYTRENERYDFKGLNWGISPLVLKHAVFVARLEEIIPLSVEFLIPDQEADDILILQAVRKTKEEFDHIIDSSLQTMKEQFEPKGWRASKMTAFAPDIVALEHFFRQSLKEASAISKLECEAVMRKALYDKIDPQMSAGLRVERTTRTASQYLAMGTVATRSNALIVNHSTVNLRHYKTTGTALVHNEVSVY